MDALAAAGFDLAHAFDPAAAQAPGLEPLAGATRALLVGNTRALWPPFSAALPALADDPDPLDHYTERVIGAAFPDRVIFYSHRPHAGRFLPFQRLAVLTGLGALSPSQLVIHPIYGPWFALRAVILLDGPAPARLPIAAPCTCVSACIARFAHAQRTGDPADWLAVRDACTLQAHRYSDAQIAYHYGRMRR